ncbi:MAG: hypothetical protein NTV34_12605 [Proteobacteria bacterium]|nr:hypothetical protein [Pseudomonadota bacterium]
MSRHWDHEFRAMALDVGQLLKQARDLPDMRVIADIGIQLKSIQESTGSIAIAGDRGRKLIRSPLKRATRFSSAVIFWARQYFSKLGCFADEFLTYRKRKMWRDLLEARFSESKLFEQATVEARDLVDLVSRRRLMAEVELNLQRELGEVFKKRESLHLQYEAIESADQNWMAASSMNARLGVNLSDSIESPSGRALRDLMRMASVALRNPARRARLSKMNRDLEMKSEKMLQKCSVLASSFVRQGRDAVDTNLLNQFKIMIEQVAELEHEASNIAQSALSEQFPCSRPKITYTRPRTLEL